MASHVLDDPEVRRLYLGHLRIGEGRHNAAKMIGQRNLDVRRYIARNSDFAEEVADAENEPLDPLVRKGMDLALGGDLEAIKFMLKSLAPDRFAEKSTVRHEHELHVSIDDLDKLAELAARADRRALELERGDIIDIPPGDISEAEVVEGTFQPFD